MRLMNFCGALVAVTVMEVCAVTVGAVKRPLEVMEPADADQVTAVLAVPVTVAVKSWCPPLDRVTLVGDTSITIGAAGRIGIAAHEGSESRGNKSSKMRRGWIAAEEKLKK